ncbi:MAG: hypothetical protein ACUVRO_08480 [Armatimonadota bacterium]
MPARCVLIVDAKTTVSDLLEFLRARSRPIHVAGSVIYDFNNHLFDEEKFVESNIPSGRYVIPFSMSDVNLDLFALLPPDIARLPRLRFNPSAQIGGYSVMPSFLPEDAAEERQLRMEVEQMFEE